MNTDGTCVFITVSEVETIACCIAECRSKYFQYVSTLFFLRGGGHSVIHIAAVLSLLNIHRCSFSVHIAVLLVSSACPVLPVRFCLSSSACPALPVLLCLSCSACPALPSWSASIIAVLFWLSYFGCPVLAVPFWLPCLDVLFWLFCSECSVLAVYKDARA